jgi:hypothetical protein
MIDPKSPIDPYVPFEPVKPDDARQDNAEGMGEHDEDDNDEGFHSDDIW